MNGMAKATPGACIVSKYHRVEVSIGKILRHKDTMVHFTLGSEGDSALAVCA